MQQRTRRHTIEFHMMLYIGHGLLLLIAALHLVHSLICIRVHWLKTAQMNKIAIMRVMHTRSNKIT